MCGRSIKLQIRAQWKQFITDGWMDGWIDGWMDLLLRAEPDVINVCVETKNTAIYFRRRNKKAMR